MVYLMRYRSVDIALMSNLVNRKFRSNIGGLSMTSISFILVYENYGYIMLDQTKLLWIPL